MHVAVAQLARFCALVLRVIFAFSFRVCDPSRRNPNLNLNSVTSITCSDSNDVIVIDGGAQMQPELHLFCDVSIYGKRATGIIVAIQFVMQLLLLQQMRAAGTMLLPQC